MDGISLGNVHSRGSDPGRRREDQCRAGWMHENERQSLQVVGEAHLKDGGEFPGLDVRLLKKLAEKYIIKPVEKGKRRYVERCS